jgi:hypothetical protein
MSGGMSPSERVCSVCGVTEEDLEGVTSADAEECLAKEGGALLSRCW